MAKSIVTPERFAKGMTFDEYCGTRTRTTSPRSLGGTLRTADPLRRPARTTARVPRALCRVSLNVHQAGAISGCAQPKGTARSSDLRTGLPIAVATCRCWRGSRSGRIELRVSRDGKKIPGPPARPHAHPDANHDLMLEFLNTKNGGEWASVPVAVFYTKDFEELHRYVEYPAIYHKDTIRGHQQAARPGETAEQSKERAQREFVAMQQSPFFDLWASAAIDEILSAIYQKLTVTR